MFYSLAKQSKEFKQDSVSQQGTRSSSKDFRRPSSAPRNEAGVVFTDGLDGRINKKFSILVPRKLQTIFILSLFAQLLLAISLVVCGIAKIKADSAHCIFSHGIYGCVLAMGAAMSGFFTNREKPGKCAFLTYLFLGFISAGCFTFLFYVNWLEMQLDCQIDRAVQSYIDPQLCQEHCLANQTSNIDCECSYNVQAYQAELASLYAIGIMLGTYLISLLIVLSILVGWCGVTFVEHRMSRILTAGSLARQNTGDTGGPGLITLEP